MSNGPLHARYSLIAFCAIIKVRFIRSCQIFERANTWIEGHWTSHVQGTHCPAPLRDYAWDDGGHIQSLQLRYYNPELQYKAKEMLQNGCNPFCKSTFPLGMVLSRSHPKLAVWAYLCNCTVLSIMYCTQSSNVLSTERYWSTILASRLLVQKLGQNHTYRWVWSTELSCIVLLVPY